ncbi:MAG: type II toxin-antitoxin system VapC family toxin [Acidisphaera sp.]|nr:type II toxin-antitoxin system VapC family toxin [Acidisphaera sp.]
MTVELIYWDSDAFLGWLQEEPGKVELCQGTLERAERGEALIVTSALTITEVLWMRRGPTIPRTKADLLRRFFRRSYIRVRNLTRAVAEAAQDIVWDHSVRPKDAIHVATALDAKVPTLETFDEVLLKRSGMIGGVPLLVRKPIAPRQSSFFR